jgi:hypothetical protein
MAKHKGIGTMFRRLSRAFTANDARAFDEALEELEEHVGDEEEPDTIEVHNHIPEHNEDRRHFDASMGELPEKDPPGFDRRSRDSEEEAPPWFKKAQEANDARFAKMQDEMNKGFAKWAKEEGEEPEHSEDRRHDDRRHDDNEEELGPEGTGEEENLEMDSHDRRDRRHDDRRSRDRRDEANREILGELEFEAPPGTADRARKARDSAFLSDAFQDTLSKAEVLAPGIRLPTYDAKASPVATIKSIDRLRRTALDLAYNKPETRGLIDTALSGRTYDSKKLPMGQTRVLFNAVSSAAGEGNNRRATDRSAFEQGGGHSTTGGGRIQSLSDINKINKEHYARH